MIVFCITSSNYIKYTLNLLKSLNDNISNAIDGICCLGINLTDKDNDLLMRSVTNCKLDIKNIDSCYNQIRYKIPDFAVCARALYLPEIIRHYQKDILYLDSDINVVDKIDRLYNLVKESDWAVGIRAPTLDPDTGNQLVGIVDHDKIRRIESIHTNAGVIFVRYTEKNLKYVDQYKDLVKNTGIQWMVDQNCLNALLTNNKNEIKIAGMPDEYISKFGTILRHFRGPNKESKYEEYNSILNGISK